MKLKCEFVINKVAGENIAVPVGTDGGFKGYIRLNETGKDIFAQLKQDTDREKIIKALQSKYPDADIKEITESVDGILAKLTSAGLMA